MSDPTKILAENQKEMLKLIALVTKKQTALTIPEETDSESENVPATATSTPIKTKSTATTHKTTPLNSRNMVTGVLKDSTNLGKKENATTPSTKLATQRAALNIKTTIRSPTGNPSTTPPAFNAKSIHRLSTCV